jgi:hypothetical protein
MMYDGHSGNTGAMAIADHAGSARGSTITRRRPEEMIASGRRGKEREEPTQRVVRWFSGGVVKSRKGGVVFGFFRMSRSGFPIFRDLAAAGGGATAIRGSGGV